jgi:hypothetical protein
MAKKVRLTGVTRIVPKVRVATTTAGTLATSFANASVVDGVTLATGDRILIKDQAAGVENGVYVVAASGAPTRAPEWAVGQDVVTFGVRVTSGTANSNTVWAVYAEPAIVGTHAPNFIKHERMGA